MQRFIPVLLLALLAAACSSKGGADKIEGDRIAVLRPAAALKADEELEKAALKTGEATANAEWPQSMGLPDAPFGNLALATKPEHVWTADIGEGGQKRKRLLSRPVASDGTVFTIDTEANVVAFKLEDGAREWDQDLKPENADEDIFGGGLAYQSDVLYAATGFGDVWALDAKTGSIKWKVFLRDVLRTPPLVYNGRVYVMTVSGQLAALDASNGTTLWTHSGITEPSALLGGATPTASGDVIFAAYNSGEVYAVRAQNGKTIWSQSLATSRSRSGGPALSDVRASPAVEGDRVYAISAGGRMAAIDMRAGLPVWDADIGGVNTPVITPDSVFVLADGSALAALEKSSGYPQRVIQLPRWEDEEDEKGAITWAGPVLGGGILWLANSEGELAGYDPDSAQRVTAIDLPGPTTIAPIIADKTLLVLTDDGELAAYR